MSSIAQLSREARQLVQDLSTSQHSVYEGGSMTSTVYDTAWVAMIVKPSKQQPQWAFPSSFNHVFNGQQNNGRWGSSASGIDNILNTSAALLCLCMHRQRPLQLKPDMEVLGAKILRAVGFLQEQLSQWDLGSTASVGFEIIVPTILDLLEDHGIYFQFNSKAALLELRERELSRVDLTSIQANQAHSHSIIHSLEGLIGKVDFDQMRKHRRRGNMMASPASTAAYLMHVSKWDKEAEKYLQNVLDKGEGHCEGAVPSAYPSSLFEMSWVVTTLFDSGFTSADFRQEDLISIDTTLKFAFDANNGLVGFASCVLPDADDTAKAIQALSYLNTVVSPNPMVVSYGQGDHFITYSRERHPTIATNCNVLISLLATPSNIQEHRHVIGRLARFLCKAWFRGLRHIEDKWHSSRMYSIMLLSKSLSRILKLWKTKSHLRGIHRTLFTEDIPLVLCQMMVNVLSSQQGQGSWEDSFEVTSYAVISLEELRQWPMMGCLQKQIRLTQQHGCDYLKNRPQNDPPEALWNDKVSYGSRYLSAAHRLAALRINCVSSSDRSDHESGNEDPLVLGQRIYTTLPLLKDLPQWLFNVSLKEGEIYQPKLMGVHQTVYPKGTTIDTAHLSFIPMTWTLAANLYTTAISPQTQFLMMTLSLSLHIVEQHMEGTVASMPARGRAKLRNAISSCIGDTIDLDKLSESQESTRILRQFIEFVVQNSAIAGAPKDLRRQLHWHVRVYLLSHLNQVDDNSTRNGISHSKGPSHLRASTDTLRRGSLPQWINEVSGYCTGGSLALYFLLCTLDPQDMSITPRAQYLLEEYSRHLNAVSRLQNDYGSLRRDLEEGNLNSIEFLATGNQQLRDGSEDSGWISSSLAELLRIADYEVAAADRLLDVDLSELLQPTVVAALRVFSGVVKLNGQMYVSKDHTRTK